jgi:hypothetical protein
VWVATVARVLKPEATGVNLPRAQQPATLALAARA